MNPKANVLYAALVGLVWGSVIFVPLAIVAYFAAGGGHGTYAPASILFPFTMFSTFFGGDITNTFVIIGVAQYPLYGLLLGIYQSRGRRGCLAWIAIVVIHLIAVILAFTLRDHFSLAKTGETRVEQVAIDNSATTVTNEATQTQCETAKKLGVPVEKTLAKSGIVLRLIPAGSYLMGSPKSEQETEVQSTARGERAELREYLERESQHKVTLTKPFYMGKYEVTQGQWEKVMGINPSCFTEAGEDAPVECVSWNDCQEFMKKLAVLEGIPKDSFRLPTEAEWEYACRAGTTTPFSYGKDIDTGMANFNGRSRYGNGKKGEYRETTLPAGHFKPNAWGLYDMHGNVWEWCEDWYGKYGVDAVDPTGPTLGSNHVLRGGGWDYAMSDCRSAYRCRGKPDYASEHTGFRCASPLVGAVGVRSGKHLTSD